MIELETDEIIAARLMVMGIGGAGNNAINRMVELNPTGVELVAVNTDVQDLNKCKAEKRLQIGGKLTRGLGAGSKPEIGKKAAEENIEEIEQILEGVDMVFVTCGMGGGTGTGATPVIADIAKKKGILTVGVVTKPFTMEGPQRLKKAAAGIENLKSCVDTLIVIPNDKILTLTDRREAAETGFEKADAVLQQSVLGITDLINKTGLINVDFADIMTAMKDKGIAHIGTGYAKGENKALAAVEQAINSPLLETVIDGATDVIINFTGDVSMLEVQEASEFINSKIKTEQSVCLGLIIDKDMTDEVEIIVIATGISEKPPEKPSVIPQDNNIHTRYVSGSLKTPTYGFESIPNPIKDFKKPSFYNRDNDIKNSSSNQMSNTDSYNDGILDIPSFVTKKDDYQ